ncbi:WD40 repeat domain-containing serine/threonine protein kinase [Nonomuraea gerenzanensis]|uniref:Tyrosine protein kinase:Serine/threonine protein kinase n=1 Tax=Nonomuraea gerenzanensis TaxID=93944 RepID=A0A1M4EGB7_9ACTN|nr:WD40 repeat domain-containing serine/threonine protein kinase [Nonomuraea gerenzanensis]UBU09200.1 protein kinase [Nonomuraea gerenzanensis]SBO97593.1 Tyrosine protein kinase:Serine/threonine protein kinase [Nonomuraea gerenzanensis]
MPEIRPLRPSDPERVGRWRLVGVLGSGGQGTVYKAVGDDGREVAVKLLHSHLSGDGTITRGFLREAEAARRVAAFCTAAVLDVGTAHEQPYLVSEYVPGDTLQQVVRSSGPRAGGALDRLAISTLTALAAIHQAGIVHRDFKPGNVLMGPDGPIVIDFGIAKALDATTMTSGVVGTPTYMSPEQFEGLRVGPASDVFSWAGTMVFAATGQAPFAGETVPAILNAVISGAPDLRGVPARLVEVLGDCFAKDPAARPAPMEVLKRLTGRPGPTGGMGSAPDGAPGPRPGDGVHPGRAHVGQAGAGHAAAGLTGVGHAAAGLTGVGHAGAGQAHPGQAGPMPPQRIGFGEAETKPGGGRKRVSRRAVLSAGAAALATAAVSAFVVFRPDEGGDRRSPVTEQPTDLTSPATSKSPEPAPTAEPLGTPIGEPVALPSGAGTPTAMTASEAAVACGTGNGSILTWDLTTTTVTRLGDGGAGTAAIAYGRRDGAPVIASGHTDGRMRLWSPSGKSLDTAEAGDAIIAVTVAGERVVAVSQRYDGMRDLHGTVRLWDVTTGEQLGPTSTDHFQGISGLAFGRLGGADVLVTGDGANRVRVRRLATGAVTHTFKTEEVGGIERLACGEVGGKPVLVSTHLDASLRVYDLATGRRRKKWSFSDRSPDDRGTAALVVGTAGGVPVAVVAHAPHGEDAFVAVWSLDDGEIVGEFGHGAGGGILALALGERAGQPVVVTAGKDRLLRLWSLGPA